MDPIKRAAVIWWNAERSRPDEGTPRATMSDIYAEAIPRVRKVFAGEVRWSEASPGDRAIWKGRPRDVELFQGRETSWFNVYDTVSHLDQVAGRGGIRMFGCKNIGDITKTNLQVPGQTSSDVTWRVAQMYGVTSRDLTTTDRILATLTIGRRPVIQANLYDLVIGAPGGYTILPRQNFEVRIDVFALSADLELRVHLEGVEQIA